ncbi:MAG: Flp pilus assembly protein CpaB [Stellaceae bacterium]
MIVRVILLLLGLVTGVLLAAAGYYGVFGTSTPKQQATAAPTPPPPPKTMVIVAAKPIPTGTLIAPQDIRFAPIPPNKVTAAEYVRVKEPKPNLQQNADRKSFQQVIGAVTRARFDQGDPVQRNDIVHPGDAGFLAAVLQPGMRAVTIAVNVVTGAAGLVHPGDHVDVVLTQVFPRQIRPGNRSVAETIATDLRVVAVDQRVQAGQMKQKATHPEQTVTLEVSPLQAEQINVATKMGELALSIRSVQQTAAGAEANAAPPGVWAKDLSPATAEVHAPHHGGPKPQLRILRGAKVENVVLP